MKEATVRNRGWNPVEGLSRTALPRIFQSVAFALVAAFVLSGCSSPKPARKYPRVKVSPVVTVRAMAKGVSNAGGIEPTKYVAPTNAPAQQIDWTKAPLVQVLAAVKADRTVIETPAVQAAILAAFSKMQVEAVVAAVTQNPIIVTVPDIAKAVFEKISRVESPDVKAAAVIMLSKIDVSSISPALLAEFVKANAQAIEKAMANPKYEFKVPAILAVIEADRTRIDSLDVFRAVAVQTTQQDAPAILAAMAVEYFRVVAKGVLPVKEIESRKEAWYERFSAPGGSQMWALLYRAKHAKETGEDLELLHRKFNDAMMRFIMEDDDAQTKSEVN